MKERTMSLNGRVRESVIACTAFAACLFLLREASVGLVFMIHVAPSMRDGGFNPTSLLVLNWAEFLATLLVTLFCLIQLIRALQAK